MLAFQFTLSLLSSPTIWVTISLLSSHHARLTVSFSQEIQEELKDTDINRHNYRAYQNYTGFCSLRAGARSLGLAGRNLDYD